MALTTNITVFLRTNKVDKRFDHLYYLQSHPELLNYYQPYCKENNISDKTRLYFHWYRYSSRDPKYIQNSSEKVIYIKPTEGLASRIYNINSIVSFAEKFNFSKVYLSWAPSQGFDCSQYTDLFDYNQNDKVTLVSDEDYNKAKLYNLNIQNCVYWDSHTKSYKTIGDLHDFIYHITNKSFCYEGSVEIHKLIPGLLEPSKLFITKCLQPSRNVLNIVGLYERPTKKSLLNMALVNVIANHNNRTVNKTLLTEMIDTHCKDGDDNVNIYERIGVHIRRDDALRSKESYKYEASSLSAFINLINYELINQPIFLSTDCAKTQQTIIDSCPQANIVYINKTFYENKINSQKKSQKEAVVDLLLLSKCKKIYGTCNSNFGKLAADIGGTDHIYENVTIDKYYQYSKIAVPDLSVIVAIKNRFRQLQVAIQSWLLQEKIKEIIVVDCLSNDFDHIELLRISDKIKIIKCDKKELNIHLALNMGLQESKHEYLLKLDVDYILNPYFSLSQWLELNWDSEFMAGNQSMSQNSNQDHLNGFLAIKKSLLKSVGGYDDSLVGYGWGSTDLNNRLIADLGLRRRIIPIYKDFVPVYHNPHTDYHRTAHQEIKNKAESILNNLVKSKYLQIIT